MFPDLGERFVITVRRNDSQNYENKTQVVIYHNDTLHIKQITASAHWYENPINPCFTQDKSGQPTN